MIPGQVTLRALAAISTEARSSRPKPGHLDRSGEISLLLLASRRFLRSVATPLQSK
jgi:hypothetical protein